MIKFKKKRGKLEMSSENRRPWYKDPRIIIPAIVAIIIAIIGYASIQRSPDFDVSVKPLTGETNPGGSPQTMVTVGDIHGYKHEVTLSASEPPPGMVVTFIPVGGPTPPYTSTVTIDVGLNVPPGDYPVIITGTGGGGEEHSCKYILTVKPMPVTPTPSPTPTFEIKITSPKEGDEVPVSIIVRGTFLGELPEGHYMWVVINPHPSLGQWWPQGGRVNPWKGQWDVQAWLGREKEDIGKEFDIAIILVNEEDDQYYWDYLGTGQETGSYPGIPLPASAKTRDMITVMRK